MATSVQALQVETGSNARNLRGFFRPGLIAYTIEPRAKAISSTPNMSTREVPPADLSFLIDTVSLLLMIKDHG